MGERRGPGHSSPREGGGNMKVDSFASSSDTKAEDPTISVAVAVLVGLVTVLILLYLYTRRRRLGRGETELDPV